MERYLREPINGLTHLAGAILSLFAMIAMVIKAASMTNSTVAVTSVVIFGISMVLLYGASATYHSVFAKERVLLFLRRLDHSMIFLLIAGSYTPFCLISLNNSAGKILFAIVATQAILGILFKMFWFHCPRWLSTTIYIVMGWMALFVFVPLTEVLAPAGFMLLVLGGVLYTIGGMIYGVKPKGLTFKNWGYHEIFHIFILLGSLCHFLCVSIRIIRKSLL